MKQKKIPLVAQTEITSFSKDGHGLGLVERPMKSVKVEVPFSLPGEKVLVELYKKKRSLYRGKLLEVVQASSDRIPGRCPHFGECGGCQWQLLPYELQLKEKEKRIHSLFSPFAKETSVFHPIIPCDPPWHYRNKVELTFSSNKKGERFLGLILQGTRGHVFQMSECSLMKPWIKEAVECFTSWWEKSGPQAYHSYKDTGSLRTLTLREGEASKDRMVILTVSGNPDYAISRSQINDLLESVEKIKPRGDSTLSVFIRIQQIAKGKPTQFYEMHLSGPGYIRETLRLKSGEEEKVLHFQISPAAFFQPNTKQAEKLYSRAIELSALSKEHVVYDLYCGTGTLGICLSHQADKVIGVELTPEAVLDGKENIALNGIDNVEIHQGDVALVLPGLLEKRRPDVVMVDPPRSGLSPKALDELLKIKPRKLTYISCNPATQAANLEALIREGYRIEAVQPVDQFPHTVHVENIVVLSLLEN